MYCSLCTTIIYVTSLLLPILGLQCIACLLGWVIVACLWPCCCCCHHRLACSLVAFQLSTELGMSLESLMSSNQVMLLAGLAWSDPLRLDNKPCSSFDAKTCPASVLVPALQYNHSTTHFVYQNGIYQGLCNLLHHFCGFLEYIN